MLSRTLRSRRRFAPGFSMLELMLVLAIIGILMAVAAVSVGGIGGRAKKRATEASLATIKTALAEYNLNHSAYPADLRSLVTAKYLEDKSLKDGWKKDFVYDPRGGVNNRERPYILGSGGEDGVVGNEDDIDVWNVGKD